MNIGFAPEVVSFLPNLSLPAETARPLISVKFNLELDESAINSDEKLANFVRLIHDKTNNLVPVTYVSYGSRLLEFRPSEDLIEGDTYKVVIRKGIPAFSGRGSMYDFIFEFKVEGNFVGTPALLAPGNDTALTSTPTFEWAPVSYQGATAITYSIEVDRSNTFNSVSEVGWSTSTTATSATPDQPLTAGHTYFWRVRTEVVSGSTTLHSDWSDVWSFYLGTVVQPLQPSEEISLSTRFGLVKSSFENGLSHQSSIPDIRLTFSHYVDPDSAAEAITMYREYVDGWPDTDKVNISLTITVTGNVVEVVPDTTITNNCRYTLVISDSLQSTNGSHLSQSETLYFTSTYSPLYVHSRVIRARLGELALDVPEDLINFNIYRTCLDLHRFCIDAPGSYIDENLIRSFPVVLTYPMERWVEHKTTARILRSKYFEILQRADTSKRLGDYSEEYGSRVLDALARAVKEEEQQAAEWFSQFSTRRTRPRTTVKSRDWNPYNKFLDKSFRDYVRDIP